jgi:hypothetical protein
VNPDQKEGKKLNLPTVEEIENFFHVFKYPECDKITLHSGFECRDAKKLVDSHISILKANPGKYRFMPYYQRLYKVYKHYQNETN